MIPSCIRPPEGYRPELREVAAGSFELANAYAGIYRYFAREPDSIASLLREPRTIIRQLRPDGPNGSPNEQSSAGKPG